MNASRPRWYRRLQLQLWLWAILPLTLVLVAVSLTGVYSHQTAMHGFVAERDEAMVRLYGRQVEDGLARGSILPDGRGLPAVIGDAHVGRRGAVYVLDDQGRVLFHPDPGYLGLDLSAEPATHQVLNSSGGMIMGSLAGDLPGMISFSSVAPAGWRVLVEEPIADINVPILRFSGVLPVPIIAAGLLSLLVLYFSIRTIVRPLQRLVEQAAQITGGDLTGLQSEVGGVEEIRQLQGALRDMVERIRRYQAGMRDYIEGITQGQEAERARLSREIHDEAVQDLVAVGQRLQLAQRALERGDLQGAQAGLRASREINQTALAGLRRTVRALRPVYLEDLGFIAALEALVREANSAGPRVALLIEGEPRRLRPEVEMAAFRVAQEALANAVQHAQARQITLSVRFAGSELGVEIADDGAGFAPPESPDTLTQAGHFGLVGMRERTLLAGGDFAVHSRPGRGTHITASWAS